MWPHCRETGRENGGNFADGKNHYKASLNYLVLHIFYFLSKPARTSSVDLLPCIFITVPNLLNWIKIMLLIVIFCFCLFYYFYFSKISYSKFFIHFTYQHSSPFLPSSCSCTSSLQLTPHPLLLKGEASFGELTKPGTLNWGRNKPLPLYQCWGRDPTLGNGFQETRWCTWDISWSHCLSHQRYLRNHRNITLSYF